MLVFSSTHNLSQVQFENLLYGYGSPNYGTQRSLCFNAMIVANLMTYGMEEPARDYSQVQYIILTGRNLTEAISTSETRAFIEALLDVALDDVVLRLGDDRTHREVAGSIAHGDAVGGAGGGMQRRASLGVFQRS